MAHPVGASLAEGVDLRGYFVWSLLDNFELRGVWEAVRAGTRGLRAPATNLERQCTLVPRGDRGWGGPGRSWMNNERGNSDRHGSAPADPGAGGCPGRCLKGHGVARR